MEDTIESLLVVLKDKQHLYPLSPHHLAKDFLFFSFRILQSFMLLVSCHYIPNTFGIHFLGRV